MSHADFVIGRFDWAKNRGGGGARDTFRLRSSSTARAIGNVRGLPQVVFKVVANGGCKGAMGLGAQLGYVLGKADHIIDPNKEFDRLDHLPAEFTDALAKDWADGWERRVKTGHSMHMVASFPNGTDPTKVAEIMRATCYDILDQGRSRFNYIAAVHTDTGRPHVHIVVDRKNADGEWFHFARDGEFTYDRVKDTIVAHAAAHGIEMVNSSRLSRGVTADAAHASDRAKNPALRGLAGTLLDHGTAPYQNNPKERPSYFVTVESPQGIKTLWGKELAPVMQESGAEKGDKIRVTHEGKLPVQVKTRDGRTIETHRNQWAVELPDRGISTASGDSAAPSPKERQGSEWKRDQVLAHAAQYRSLSVTFSDGFAALSRGFTAAADLLERGLSLTPEILQQARRITMPETGTLDAATAKQTTIEQGVQAEIADYRKLGYDRASIGGHLPEIQERVELRVAQAEANGEQLGSWSRLVEADERDELRGLEAEARAQDRLMSDGQGYRVMPSEADLAADTAKALTVIEEARDKLAEVRDTIPQLSPAERPEVEAQYFAAVRDVERLSTGIDRAEYSEPAQGTIYADGHREAVAAMGHGQLETALQGTGIDASEVAARVNVEMRSAALEAHWVAVDAQSIATARGYDMATEEGSRQAFNDLAATYKGLTSERGEELTIPVITGEGERLELTRAEIEARAEQDPGLRLVDPVDDDDLLPTIENITAVQDYMQQERAREAIDYDAHGDPDFLGAQAEAQFAALESRGLVETADDREERIPDVDAHGDPDFLGSQAEAQFANLDDRGLVEALEDREALLAEARDLASREHLSPEQRDRLVAIVEEVAGKDAIHELRAGNSDALSEILPDKADRLDVAEKYLEAERDKGLDRDDALTVVQKERELMEIDEKLEQQNAVERETEARRERSRDDGHDL